MAAMCVALHMAPADYWAMRADEYAALVDELKRQAKRG